MKSGIHPGLVTITVKDVLSKSPNLMVDVKRPILISLSEEKLCQLKMIKEEMEVFQSRNDNILESQGNSERSLPFTSVDVTTSQIMCKYDFKNNNFTLVIHPSCFGPTVHCLGPKYALLVFL